MGFHLDWLKVLPALGEHPLLLSFLWFILTLSYLVLTHWEQRWPSGGCWRWRQWCHLGCLPTFSTLHLLQWLSVLSVRAHSAPLDPAVPPFGGLEGCADRRVRRFPWDGWKPGRRWQKEEATPQRERKSSMGGGAKPLSPSVALCWCSSGECLWFGWGPLSSGRGKWWGCHRVPELLNS